jgi:hypothetical protein
MQFLLAITIRRSARLPIPVTYSRVKTSHRSGTRCHGRSAGTRDSPVAALPETRDQRPAGLARNATPPTPRWARLRASSNGVSPSSAPCGCSDVLVFPHNGTITAQFRQNRATGAVAAGGPVSLCYLKMPGVGVEPTCRFRPSILSRLRMPFRHPGLTDIKDRATPVPAPPLEFSAALQPRPNEGAQCWRQRNP